jgi:hypothetical protein
MRKDQATQLSTNHWFLTNQTHSESEVRENGCQEKSRNESQDKKFKKSLEILRLFMHANEDKKYINQWSKKNLMRQSN